MYIRRVTVENVKSFQGKHVFNLHPGVNFFVGDNNSGKSTVLEALLFLFEGPSKTSGAPDTFYNSSADGPTRVEVDIAGDVDELVQQEKFNSLKDFVFNDGGERILRLDRSSEDRIVTQGKKEKRVDVKAVCFWNPDTLQFENRTGIDARVKAIFDFEAVWADSHPSDHIDFSSSKTLGRLIGAKFEEFAKTDKWKSLQAAHEKAFGFEEEGSFTSEVEELANSLKGLVDEQYGVASYRFDFGLPDAGVFMKQGSLHVNDGAGETPIDGKGTGMQRAVALGFIQLYARSAAALEGARKPLILMLDEPETWLHPTAQLRLGDAVSRIGENEQVFIVTHSPYLIRKFKADSHLLTVLSGKGEGRTISSSTNFGLFGPGEPTWGEINYRAFGVCSNDFHNELYGHIQRYLDTSNGDGNEANTGSVDTFLFNKGVPKNRKWIRMPSFKSQDVTLPIFIRHTIHHPENNANASVTEEELANSTHLLVKVVEEIGLIEEESTADSAA
ncbi:AAA family ATPase [Brevibacterium litoralis]|uniref:AAA family ATPase n=1 Tax=Brevibacterium litoralis TaxID=3138935 RepID=UPI0032EC0B4C